MMRFVGSIPAKLDTKGRVFLPSAFRKMMPEGEERIVLRIDDYQPCLVVLPYNAWEMDVATLEMRINRWNADEAKVLRRFLSDVEMTTLDANGRLLLPKRYLEKAGIGAQVTFVGMGDRIEIWDKSRTDEPFMTAEDYAAALQKIMSGD